jgi:hypothetical protein
MDEIMKYFVSRQHYWGIDDEDAYVVEIASGGVDMSGSDMLVPKWKSLGEGAEYNDPREAAKAAISICEHWRKIQPLANVAHGSTGGFTIPFEPCTYEELEAWAEKAYTNLAKCTECGNILGKETFTHDLVCDDEKFCSQNCADNNYQKMNADRMHSSKQECVDEGDHLLSVDEDGYCNYCGEQ